MSKIRWSMEERQLLLDEVKHQHFIHPSMRTLDLVRMAQKIALPTDRRIDITGTQQIEWIDKERDTWVGATIPIREEIKVKDDLVEEPTKPYWKTLLTDLLADAMVQVVAEAIIKARRRLDLPVVEIPDKPELHKPGLKKIVIYGLFSNQVKDIRKQFHNCFEFRFLKDVSPQQLEAGAKWADHFIVMTKFVSHDYGAIKKYGNVLYLNGAASNHVTKLEEIYLEETKI